MRRRGCQSAAIWGLAARRAEPAARSALLVVRVASELCTLRDAQPHLSRAPVQSRSTQSHLDSGRSIVAPHSRLTSRPSGKRRQPLARHHSLIANQTDLWPLICLHPSQPESAVYLLPVTLSQSPTLAASLPVLFSPATVAGWLAGCQCVALARSVSTRCNCCRLTCARARCPPGHLTHAQAHITSIKCCCCCSFCFLPRLQLLAWLSALGRSSAAESGALLRAATGA